MEINGVTPDKLVSQNNKGRFIMNKLRENENTLFSTKFKNCNLEIILVNDLYTCFIDGYEFHRCKTLNESKEVLLSGDDIICYYLDWSQCPEATKNKIIDFDDQSKKQENLNLKENRKMKNLQSERPNDAPEYWSYYDQIEQNIVNGTSNKELLNELETKSLFILYRNESSTRLLNEVEKEINSRLLKKYKMEL